MSIILSCIYIYIYPSEVLHTCIIRNYKMIHVSLLVLGANVFTFGVHTSPRRLPSRLGSHLKMDGWNTRSFPFGMAYFQGPC